QAIGGRAALTLVNRNRCDIRLTQIDIKADPAIAVSINTGEVRDAIAAALRRSQTTEGEALIIDLRDLHYMIEGSSIGMAAQRVRIPLKLTRAGDRQYTQSTVTLSAVVRYILSIHTTGCPAH